MELILTLIVSPVVVLGIGATVKILWDMRSELSSATSQLAEQDKLWKQNEREHLRAFQDIASLKSGQAEIKGMLRILVGDRDASE